MIKDINPSHLDFSSEVFDTLSKVTEVLEDVGCQYFLAGGTLLGAVRDGQIIPHDRDFDIDCFAEDRRLILSQNSKFLEFGIQVKEKILSEGVGLSTNEPVFSPHDCSCIYVLKNGRHYGDIYLFTRFSDGIARRYDSYTRTYFNPKMSIPNYFYSGNEVRKIFGRDFRVPQNPEAVIEKIYGNDWRIPLKIGDFEKGRNRLSGAVMDSDIEMLISLAIKEDSTREYSGFPDWPASIAIVNSEAGCRWVRSHECARNESTREVELINAVGSMLNEFPQWKLNLAFRAYATLVFKPEIQYLLTQNRISFFAKLRRRILRKLRKVIRPFSLEK